MTKYALFVPIFDELADPRVVVDVATTAEASGWDGVFVWDHMLYRAPVRAVADPWITMTAIATSTERLEFGPMVTPVARRRPQKLARECITLDQVSNGRLVFGAGLGGDPGGELTHFNEELDPVVRAARLDAGLELLHRWWLGEEAAGVRLLPRPARSPRIPVWIASVYPHQRPLHRVARWDGWFPIRLPDPDALVEQSARVRDLRAADQPPIDIAVQGLPDADPAPWTAAGATWWLVRFEPYDLRAADVRAVAEAGPPRP